MQSDGSCRPNWGGTTRPAMQFLDPSEGHGSRATPPPSCGPPSAPFVWTSSTPAIASEMMMDGFCAK
eukprot:2506982-Pyramimonas_sp.AAC.1